MFLTAGKSLIRLRRKGESEKPPDTYIAINFDLISCVSAPSTSRVKNVLAYTSLCKVILDGLDLSSQKLCNRINYRIEDAKNVFPSESQNAILDIFDRVVGNSRWHLRH